MKGAEVTVVGREYVGELVPPGMEDDIFAIQLGIVSQLELDKVLEDLVQRSAFFFDADLVALFLSDASGEFLEVRALAGGRSWAQVYLGERILPGQTAAGLAFKEKRTLLVDDYTSWGGRYQLENPSAMNEVGPIMAAPLYWGDEDPVGALTVVAGVGEPPYGEKSVRRLESLAMLASIAIRNASDRESILGLNRSLEERNESIAANLSLAEDTLYQRNSELNELLKKAARAQQDERRRIARDIHDDVLQYLYGATALLEAASQSMGSEPERALSIIQHSRSCLDKMEGAIRMAIENLRRGSMSNSFDEALKEYLYSFVAGEKVRIDFSVAGEGGREIGEDAESIALRIVQEAVQNVLSHANATVLTVRLEYGDEALKIVVADDGSGMVLQEYGEERKALVLKDGHYGMRIMHERSGEIGARLDIRSELGVGSAVVLEVPYRNGFVAGGKS